MYLSPRSNIHKQYCTGYARQALLLPLLRLLVRWVLGSETVSDLDHVAALTELAEEGQAEYIRLILP